jgi:hypothetical protein
MKKSSGQQSNGLPLVLTVKILKVKEPVAKPHFGPNPRFCRMDSVSPQVAYSQQDMSTCGWTEPGPKSSNLCKKASFATGSKYLKLRDWDRKIDFSGFTNRFAFTTPEKSLFRS